MHVGQQRLAKVVDGKGARPPLPPIGIISEGVHAHILEAWLLRQPLLGPVMGYIRRFAPCLPRTAAKTVYEDEVDERVRGFVDKRETQRTP